MKTLTQRNVDKSQLNLRDHGKLIHSLEQANIYDIGGIPVVQDKASGELLDFILMDETYFKDNWLAMFAIGSVNGINYFDMKSWYDLTEQFTSGVIIIDQHTHIPVFAIPKFIEPLYQPSTREMISRLSRMASEAHVQTNPAAQEATVSELAMLIKTLSENEDYRYEGVTGRIPPEVYAYYGVNPKVMKAMIFIRDCYGTLTPDMPVWSTVEAILKKHYTNQSVTYEEKKIIWQLTEQEFDFGDADDPLDVPSDSKPTQRYIFNPDED